MSTLNALTLSIGVLAAVLTWLFLGPLAGMLQIWIAFIAWGCFYHCGGKEAGLKNTIVSMIFGAIVGWVALLIVAGVPLAGTLGLPVWAGIVVGIGVAILVAGANTPLLAAIPANVYGFAAVAGYTLLANKVSVAGLTEPTLANPLINVVISAVIGAIVGYISEKIGGALAKS